MDTTQNGFTMIEMIVVVSIVAILMAIGAPSYRYVTTSNRIAGEINSLVGDLQYARSEAIKEGQTVTVCASTDQATCVGGGATWTTGWIVFMDGANVGTVDPNESILRTRTALTSGDTLAGDSNVSAITFNREGFAQGLAGMLTLKLHEKNSVAGYTRCLEITIVGAMATRTKGQVNCT